MTDEIDNQELLLVVIYFSSAYLLIYWNEELKISHARILRVPGLLICYISIPTQFLNF